MEYFLEVAWDKHQPMCNQQIGNTIDYHLALMALEETARVLEGLRSTIQVTFASAIQPQI